MSEMVERMAAVFAAELMELTADQRRSFVFPDDVNGDTCDRARSAARKALKAIQEPTKAMVECWDFSDQKDAAECWRDMVAVELKASG